MGEECSRNQKWEEQMYWNHFQTVQFCQILSGRRFTQQLDIPKRFANNVREKLSGSVALRGPSGYIWNVELVHEADTLLLKHGWTSFVEDQSLMENDVLIFKYNSSLQFDVSIFDQGSLCEKEASYFVKRKCGDSQIDRNNRVKESSDDRNNQVESSDDVAVTNPSQTMRAKWSLSRGYVSQRRRVVVEEKREEAHQMALAAPSENSFVVVMRETYVNSGYYVIVPWEWYRKHKFLESRVVELRTDGKKWPVNYLYDKHGGRLSAGWRKFVVENSVKEFDVCLFDLVSQTGDFFIFDVQIFHANDGSSHKKSWTNNNISKGVANKRRRTAKASSEDNSYESSHDVVARKPLSSTKTMRSNGNNGLRSKTMRRKRSLSSVYLQSRSSGRDISKYKKDRAHAMALAELSDNNFVAVMRSSYIFNGYVLVPAKWARKHKFNESLEAELCYGGKTWLVKYTFGKPNIGCRLIGGWGKFVCENSLQVFDVCVFDLVRRSHNSITLDVKIFRVTDGKQTNNTPRRDVFNKGKKIFEARSDDTYKTSEDDDSDDSAQVRASSSMPRINIKREP